jgi:hypothetical protein
LNKTVKRHLALRGGLEYVDGTREQGYGGYRDDSRWLPIADDILRQSASKPRTGSWTWAAATGSW